MRFRRRPTAGINLLEPKIGGYPEPLRAIPRPGQWTIAKVVANEMYRLEKLDLRPWFLNIDADWWDEARRRDDLHRPAIRPLPDGNWTFYGLPVLVWAPGSPQSRGVTIHAYPPRWPRR